LRLPAKVISEIICNDPCAKEIPASAGNSIRVAIVIGNVFQYLLSDTESKQY
jgi:hypothetical protein